jgi:dihydrofolate synthase/folylpolyglutamate synthase
MAHETIDWLYGLQHFGIKLGLDNIRVLLELLHHPERAYKCIHVAGTNGKGSVAAMADAILTAAGVRSGLFTSPHLVRPNERIRIGGREIADDYLHQLLREMRSTIEAALSSGELESQPSFFEVITATALEAFAKEGMQTAILEVGLGGRLDATNAVDADVCVVVSIGLDHTKTLGPTLELIAGEKAGIIKPGRPVVSGVVQPRAIEVLQQACSDHGAALIHARSVVRLVSEKNDRFTLATSRCTYQGLHCALPGRHQIDNAMVALAACELLAARIGLTLDVDAVRNGLASIHWPGRLQWIEPANGWPRLLLDGAHNPAGVAAVASYLRSRQGPRPVLMFGATSGKPLDKLLAPLAGLVDGVVFTRPPVERGLDPEEVASAASGLFQPVEAIPDPAEALNRAGRLAGGDRYVLVTGSLYLVGEVLGLLTTEDVPGPIAM